MAKREYVSMRGKKVDLELLKKMNELVPAVGNAKVNARGDELGPGGKIIRKREDIVKDYYKSNPNQVIQESGKRVEEKQETVATTVAPVAETLTQEKTKDTKTLVTDLPSPSEIAEWEEDEEGNFTKKDSAAKKPKA